MLKRFFDQDLPLERVVFNRIAIGGILGGSVSTLATLIMGFPKGTILMTLVAVIVISVCFYWANYCNLLNRAIVVTCITVAMVLFPVMCSLGRLE